LKTILQKGNEILSSQRTVLEKNESVKEGGKKPAENFESALVLKRPGGGKKTN